MKEVISELCWQTSQTVSCFQLIVKYEFPKESTAKALTSFSYGSFHTCSLTQQRREFHLADSTSNTALYLIKPQLTFNATRRVLMLHTLQKMEKVDVQFFLLFTSPEVFVSNEKWRTVLQHNVFWKHLIGRAVGKIHTAAQSQLKWLIRLLHLGSHRVKITALHWFSPNNLIGGLFC